VNGISAIQFRSYRSSGVQEFTGVQELQEWQECRSGRIKPRIPVAGEGGVTSPEVVESWENATAYRSLALA
jgi:hypothetical protein